MSNRIRTTRGPAPQLPRSFRVTVGVHSSEAGQDHGELTVGDVANFGEYGTRNAPARAPIRTWFDESVPEFPALFRRALVFSREQAPEAIALKLQAGIQRRIAEGLPPPNAPSTIAQKGSSTPLIDSGVLRSSYLARVEDL